MERIKFLIIVVFVLSAFYGSASAQVEADSIRTKSLGEVTIFGEKLFTIERLWNTGYKCVV